MLEIVDGDLLDTKCKLIMHQVNCKGVMGAGVARVIAKRYPEVEKQYKEWCTNLEGQGLLGSAHLEYTNDGKIVISLFAQYSYGRDKQHTNYNAFDNGLGEAIDILRWRHPDLSPFTIAIPYEIGCGLAGGDWNKIVRILEWQEEHNSDVFFIAYRLKERKL